MVILKFRGFCAPVFQIFNKDLSINTKLIPKYAEYLAKNEIKGVLVHGTTGEGMSLSVNERKLVVEQWARTVQTTKQHLMVQVGGCPVPDVLELANHAEKTGADSILCLPELYFRPSDTKELIDYLRLIGEAAPKTPLLYYHNPKMSGVNLNMAKFINEAGATLPTFQGIKYTSKDVESGLAALKVSKGKYAIFLGQHMMIAPAFAMGFDSNITSVINIFPRFFTNIKKFIELGKIDEAVKLQHRLIAAADAVTRHGDWMPSLKAGMCLLTPIDVGKARPPSNSKNLNEEQLLAMKKSLEEESLL